MKYFLVEGMGWRPHTLLHVLDRSSFELITLYLWSATPFSRLEWPAHAQFIGPNIFPSVHFWLPNGLVFVHPEVHVAVEVFGPKFANGLECETLVDAQ